MLKKWLREPLLHFLLIGAALFILYGLQNDQPVNNENRIVISEANIDRLLTVWQKKWQRLPTQSELNGMIEAQIREEVLYRESLAMGLDQNDAIVRRRLAQKVEFIFSDIASQAEPNDTELEAYLTEHADKFGVPARISFQQIYLNSDKRGQQAVKDAEDMLAALSQQDPSIDITAAGDPFMFGQQHEDLTSHGVARLFGKDFSASLFSLQAGGWQGPVQSGYGLHLVRISDIKSASQPSLDSVRQKVLNEWQTQQRQTMNEQFYLNLKTQYEIIIEGLDRKDTLASKTGSNQN